MALLDFLKRKKEIEKSKKPVAKKAERALAAPKTIDAQGRFSYEIVREPHISEKGTILSEQDQYVFKIYRHANKPEIKQAIKGIYGVDVVKVNVVTIPKKKRRLGRTEGFKKAYRKAIVTIKKGQKIEVF